MGRPATAPNRRQVGLDDELWERVTNYRFDRRLDSESAALRELVVMGLEVAERKPAPAKKPATAQGSRSKVARLGGTVELPTRGFAVPRSTNWGR